MSELSKPQAEMYKLLQEATSTKEDKADASEGLTAQQEQAMATAAKLKEEIAMLRNAPSKLSKSRTEMYKLMKAATAKKEDKSDAVEGLTEQAMAKAALERRCLAVECVVKAFKSQTEKYKLKKELATEARAAGGEGTVLLGLAV